MKIYYIKNINTRERLSENFWSYSEAMKVCTELNKLNKTYSYTVHHETPINNQ